MFKHTERASQLELTFDTTELNTPQIRLIKSINATLQELLVTTNEHYFFEKSNEVMKLMAYAIKEAHFAKNGEQGNHIPYADQAIEFSLDDLLESLHSPSSSRFSLLDN